MNFPRAIISYDRLHSGVERVAGSRFNLLALKQALSKANADNPLFHISAMPDAERLSLLANRLDFTIVREPSDSAAFFEQVLKSELCHNRHYDPRPVLVFGAKASEATLLHRLHDDGSTITAFHWAKEFDAEILKVAHSCYALNSHLLVNPHERQLAAFAQAD